MKTEDIKRMAQAWLQVQEASKKKLDPVDHSELKGTHAQRKDKDINNDGKVDKADEYLHNRRKAVSAAIKGKGKEVEVQTSEGKLPPALQAYIDKKKGKKSKDKDDDEDDMKEEVEELDELSKKTLGSYVKKAAGDAVTKAYRAGDVRDKDSGKNYYKALGRQIGISTATNKLTKEEVNYPHMMYHSETGKSVKVKSPEEHNMYAKKGYTHDKPKMDEAKLTDKQVKQVKAALSSAKAKPKDKVSLKPAPWDMKKESVQTEAATASISGRPGVASPPGEGLSPSAKRELARKTPMPDFVNEPKVDKKTFDSIRASSKKAPARHGDALKGDKNIINKPLDITAKAPKKENDGFKDS